MRIAYPNINRAKKIAKSLHAELKGFSLSKTQEILARISGYRDWSELNHLLKTRQAVGTFFEPADWENQQRCVILSKKLCDETGITWSTALYVISKLQMPSASVQSLKSYEEIWLSQMMENHGFSGRKKTPGSLVKINASGWGGEIAYIQRYGRPTILITNKCVNTGVADFEVTFPRNPVKPFIPARLKFIYGVWVEKDGSRVFFSRDYKPLWRIRDNRSPERLKPWLWINFVDQKWFWEDVNPPWLNRKRYAEEETRLLNYNIRALPQLADVLPILLSNQTITRVDDAVDVLAKREDPTVVKTIRGYFSKEISPSP